MSAGERLAAQAQNTRCQKIHEYVKVPVPTPEVLGAGRIVVIASSSSRKLIDAYMSLTGDYPSGYDAQPLDHQDDFELHVFNGDGNFSGVIYLGYDPRRNIHFFGMSTDGEKDSHNAKDEATNKRDAVVEAWRAQYPDKEDQDVIIMSLDTVSKGSHGEYVGKPANVSGFDRTTYEMVQRYRQGEKLPPHDLIGLTLFHQWMDMYLRLQYGEGDPIVHTTAVALLNLATDQELRDKLDYVARIHHSQLSTATSDPYASGAAAAQRAAGLGENYDPRDVQTGIDRQLTELWDYVPRSSAEQLYYQQLRLHQSIGLELLKQFQGMPFEFALLLLDQLLKIGEPDVESTSNT